MRNCIAGATPLRKIFRAQNFPRKNRRNEEMPMN
jgi:hypothetical protein